MVQMSYFLGNIQKRVKRTLTYTLDPLKLCSLGRGGPADPPKSALSSKIILYFNLCVPNMEKRSRKIGTKVFLDQGTVLSEKIIGVKN